MTRVLSGVRASGDLHAGNYFGALRQWVEAQSSADCFYFIADLHALTTVDASHSASDFKNDRIKTAAAFIASGLDPERATLFFQSAIPEHTQLMWYVAAVARKGELDRMTQFKEKSGTNQAGAAGTLYLYPVLMAADILLYDADEVPVGDDQKQHVEVTRDWAERFNSYFGPTFVVPRATLPAEGARLMDLQYPHKKMSKSDGSELGTLYIADSDDDLRKKIRRAVTDADKAIYVSREKPGISNLIGLYAAAAGLESREVQEQFAGSSYGTFKEALADLIIEVFRPIRERYLMLLGDRAELERVMSIGTERASSTAAKTCERARQALGLVQ